MQTASIDFNTQKFFQPHVAQLDAIPEVIEQRELAGLIRRLKSHQVEAERLRETVSVTGVEAACIVE